MCLSEWGVRENRLFVFDLDIRARATDTGKNVTGAHISEWLGGVMYIPADKTGAASATKTVPTVKASLNTSSFYRFKQRGRGICRDLCDYRLVNGYPKASHGN